jgi:DNA topoisomerase-1
VAGLGRFGPYVKHGDDYRSLEETDDLFTIDLTRALALFAAPKRAGRRQAAAKKVIAKIEAPDGGAAIQVLEGRFGPYVTDGETNASVPRGMDPATLSLDDARGLLEARRNAAPRAGRRRAGAAKSAKGKSTARGRKAAAAATETDAAPAKKAKAKKTATAKKTARKTTARKRTGV